MLLPRLPAVARTRAAAHWLDASVLAVDAGAMRAAARLSVDADGTTVAGRLAGTARLGALALGTGCAAIAALPLALTGTGRPEMTAATGLRRVAGYGLLGLPELLLRAAAAGAREPPESPRRRAEALALLTLRGLRLPAVLVARLPVALAGAAGALVGAALGLGLQLAYELVAPALRGIRMRGQV